MKPTNKDLCYFFDLLINFSIIVPLFVIPLLFHPQLLKGYITPKETFYQISILFLLAVTILRKIAIKEKFILFPTSISFASAIFFLCLLISLFKAINLHEGSKDLIHFAAGVSLLLLLNWNYKALPSFSLIFNASILSASVVSMIGIYLSYGGSFFFLREYAHPASTFGNKNLAASYIICIIPLAMYKLLVSSSTTKKTSYTISISLMSSYLFFTNCKAAGLGITVGFVFFILFVLINKVYDFSKILRGYNFFSKKNIFFTMLAVSLFLITISIPNTESLTYTKKILNLDHSGYDNSSFYIRLLFWKNSMHMVSDHILFGVGPGNFKIIYPKYLASSLLDTNIEYDYLIYLHNDFLEILAEAGIVGFLSFLIFIFLILKISYSIILEEQNVNNVLSTLFLNVGLLGLLINSFFSFSLKMPTESMCFWLFSGLIGVTCIRLKPDKNLCSVAISRSSSFALLLLLSIAGYKINQMNYKNIFYEKYLFTAYENMRSDPMIARIMSMEAARIYPEEYEGQIVSAGQNLFFKDFEKAQFYLKRALHFQPFNPLLFDMLGYTFFVQNDYTNALLNFKKAMLLKPNYLKSIIHTASAYWKMGEYKTALTFFDNALKIDPKNKESLKAVMLLKGEIKVKRV